MKIMWLCVDGNLPTYIIENNMQREKGAKKIVIIAFRIPRGFWLPTL